MAMSVDALIERAGEFVRSNRDRFGASDAEIEAWLRELRLMFSNEVIAAQLENFDERELHDFFTRLNASLP